MKRILVTGGAGFIGTNFVSFILRKTDWQIRVIDNLSARGFGAVKNLDSFDGGRVELVEGDIRDEEMVKEVVKGCDYVVNLAAQVGVMPSVEDPKFDADVNVNGLLNVLEASKEEGLDKFVQASSAAPLGEVEPPVSEQDVPRPLAPYGASKLSGEGYCSAYAGSFGLNTVALRFSNVYGPHSLHKESVVHKFIRRILKGEELFVYGDGEQTRDYIHTEDICRGIYMALKEDKEGFELLQLGTGEETSVNELIGYLEDVAEKKNVEFPEVINKEERKGEIRRNFADISKVKEVLGFEPSVDVKEGLEETLEWYLRNEDKI
ncbi:MAG: GDP-mannose 4,6-dehydratase [Candidatus Aenigmatarchaeota archaeon]